MADGGHNPWEGRTGMLLRRFNRDWVEVRRSLAEREPSAAAGAPVHYACPAALCPPPPRIAVAPCLW